MPAAASSASRRSCGCETSGSDAGPCEDASDDEFRVHQYGPRRLWDEVHTARQWWVEQGTPDADRWRFTVTPEGQRIELN